MNFNPFTGSKVSTNCDDSVEDPGKKGQYEEDKDELSSK